MRHTQSAAGIAAATCLRPHGRRPRRSVLLAWLWLSFTVACQAQPADPWHRDLCFSFGDLWTARFPLDLSNSAPRRQVGQAVTLPIGNAPGQVPLAGIPAREIRVCDASGTEMLFRLRQADGALLDDAAIPAAATLTVPWTASPGASQRLYVYFANPDAYPVPDHLPVAEEPRNLDLETGAGGRPDGWTFDSTDEQHQISWVEAPVHAGRRALRVTVPAAAAATWVTARQRDLPVVPGGQYRIRAWVRGQDVTGKAGWFVHVATPQDPQKVSLVVAAGEGTFDWRPVTVEFTAPDDAISLSHGTILYGTGAAWFDDVSLEAPAPPRLPVTVRVGALERLELASLDSPGFWPPSAGAAWDVVVAASVTNVGEAIPNAVVRLPLTALRTRLRGAVGPDSYRLYDPASGAEVPMLDSGRECLFETDLPARCRKVFRLYASRAPRPGPGLALSYGDLVRSSANRLRNPSFEEGDQAPTAWEPMSEAARITATMERVAGGPDGRFCARFAVPPAERVAWTGWRQTLDLEPNAEYLVQAWVRTQDLTGSAQIHAHLLDQADRQTVRRYWSGGPQLSGTADWQRLGGSLRTGAGARGVHLFLTMNTSGTIWHDGALVVRVLPARLGAVTGNPATTRPAARLAVWTANPVVKIFRDTPAATPAAQLTLSAARGEEESIQVCVRSVSAVSGLRLEVEPPSRNGKALPTPRVEQVLYVPCLQDANFCTSTAQPWERRIANGGRRNDGWQGWWPDCLVPVTAPLDIEAGTTQPFWLTFTVPRAAEPGDYQGQVRIILPDGTTQALPLRCRVWRLQLPPRPSLQVLFDLRDGPSSSLFPTPAERQAWWRFMASKHLSTDRVLPAPQFRLEGGEVRLDASGYDQAASLCFDQLQMAASYFPEAFYACGWAHPPRPFLGFAFGTPEYRSAYQKAVGLFWSHAQTRGWADRFSLYVSDEPHYEARPEVVRDLAAVIRLSREVDPAIPVYSSTWGHEPAWDGILNHWGIAQYGKFPLGELRQRQAAGDKIWFTTDGQFELDTPYCAGERLLPYYCFAYNVSGYEHWALAWFTHDPFRFGWYGFIPQSDEPGKNAWTLYPNGSGHLAYPGEPLGRQGPLSSIRLEQIREGIEDYEILAALRRQADAVPAVAQELQPLFADIQRLVPIPNAQGYRSTEILPDPDALLHLRQRAGDALDELLSR